MSSLSNTGSSAKWRKLRESIIKRDGCCQMCGTEERLSVDHINPEKRITAIWYDRDEDIEAKMVARLKEASDLYHEYFTQLQNK